LAEKGFDVDAVDLSDYALSKVRDDAKIHKIEADLDEYDLEKNKYDLIVNMNYLNRRFYHQIKEALRPDGVVIFETFIIASWVGFLDQIPFKKFPRNLILSFR